MATNRSSRAAPGFLADTQSPEAVRRQFIDQPMDASRQPVLDSAIELLGLMTLLPKAFAASQRREYERLLRTTDDEKDPRLVYMKASLERADGLREKATIGQARIERALVAVGGDGDVFHGFVQDASLAPRAGATVRLSSARGDTSSAGLSATTDKDGHFSISLDRKTPSKPQASAIPVGLSTRMAELLDAVNRRDAQPGTTSAADKDPQAEGKVVAKVEIFDVTGKLLHTDPFPLPIDSGSAYREYVVGDGDGPIGKTPTTGDDRKTPTPASVPAPGKTAERHATPTPQTTTKAAATPAAKPAAETAAAPTAKPIQKPAQRPKPTPRRK